MASESKPFLQSPSSENVDLDDTESSSSSSFHKPKSHRYLYIQIVTAVFICILSISLGYFLGERHSHAALNSKHSYGGLLPPEGHITQIWQHNLTFSQSPTPESEEAWNSLIPVGRGFIHQPEIAPFISNIAVFHQLHCLHAILTAHYASQDQLARVLKGEDVNDSQELYGARIASDHIRHCFDYLRRNIMCAADTNLEVVSRQNHTTNGWGQEKTCRDYSAVVKYAEIWANSTDTGIVPGVNKHHGHGHGI